MAGGRGLKIGVALGDQSLVAVLLGRKGAPTARVHGDFREEHPQLGAELRRAFIEVKAALEARGAGATDGAGVNIAVLPPIADARLIPFPPMRREEVEAVLTRDVARYFFGANRPRVVGVLLPGRNGPVSGNSEGAPVPVLAAAAPLAFLEEVREAVADAGWRCRSLSGAFGGWTAAAGSMKGSRVQAVVAVVGRTAHLLRLGSGGVGGVRQVSADDPEGVAEAMGPASGKALLLASTEAVNTVQSALARKGWSIARDPGGWGSAEEATAARAGAGGLEFLPPSLKEERRGATQRRATFMLAGAVALLLAAAGTHLWGAHRDLAAIQERRAAIRSEVGPLLLARDSLNALTSRIQVLEELEESAPVWTRSLVELTALLPRDTYLTAFYASGDTVELEAAGTGAGEAIQSLRASGLFEDLRLQGIVERELADGETVAERFTVRGRLPAAREGGGP